MITRPFELDVNAGLSFPVTEKVTTVIATAAPTPVPPVVALPFAVDSSFACPVASSVSMPCAFSVVPSPP